MKEKSCNIQLEIEFYMAVSSMNFSCTIIKDKGTYGIYLRNYSGFQYK